MNMPRLIIIEKVAGNPVKGGCSACEGVIFTPCSKGFTSGKQMLEIQFREHFRTVHEGEAATCAAAGRTGN
ncbi:MAG: hypothetical protein ABSD39_20420 [Terriglobales bacterium]|jgi:hypothetical protein